MFQANPFLSEIQTNTFKKNWTTTMTTTQQVSGKDNLSMIKNTISTIYPALRIEYSYEFDAVHCHTVKAQKI